MTVPIQHGNGAAVPYAECFERGGELPDTLAQIGECIAQLASITDLLAGAHALRIQQQLLDEQWVSVGRRSRDNQVVKSVGVWGADTEATS